MADEVVVSTRDRVGTFDGLASAKPGEPTFTLQGGDPLGPPTVAFWAGEARKLAFEQTDEEEAKRLLRRASSADQVVWAMQDYQKGIEPHQVETPVERDVKEKDRHDQLSYAADRLHNALAESNDMAELLARMREFPMAEVKIREAVAMLKEAAAEIEPRRHLRRAA